MSEFLQILTTTATRQQAEQIGQALVARRLAACAQISGPITSIYRWNGNVETSDEWRLTIKSMRSHFPAVSALITELHDYDVPEILGTSVDAISPEYRDWLLAELANPKT